MANSQDSAARTSAETVSGPIAYGQLRNYKSTRRIMYRKETDMLTWLDMQQRNDAGFSDSGCLTSSRSSDTSEYLLDGKTLRTRSQNVDNNHCTKVCITSPTVLRYNDGVQSQLQTLGLHRTITSKSRRSFYDNLSCESCSNCSDSDSDILNNSASKNKNKRIRKRKPLTRSLKTTHIGSFKGKTGTVLSTCSDESLQQDSTIFGSSITILPTATNRPRPYQQTKESRLLRDLENYSSSMRNIILVCMTFALTNPVLLLVVIYYCIKAHRKCRARKYNRGLWYLNRAAVLAMIGFILSAGASITALFLFRDTAPGLTDITNRPAGALCVSAISEKTYPPELDSMLSRNKTVQEGGDFTKPNSAIISGSETFTPSNNPLGTTAPTTSQRKFPNILDLDVWDGPETNQRAINQSCTTYSIRGRQKTVCLPGQTL